MSKRNTIVAVVAVVFIVGVGCLAYRSAHTVKAPALTENVALDVKNCTYTINNESVALKDGYSEVSSVPGSASKTITQYFGNEASTDLNADGVSDTAFILTQNAGGSGTFYYVVAGLSGAAGCTGTNAVLLGDRIAPQTTRFENGKIVVNYADRKPSDPMTTAPSVGVSRYFSVSGGSLSEAL